MRLIGNYYYKRVTKIIIYILIVKIRWLNRLDCPGLIMDCKSGNQISKEMKIFHPI